MPDSDPGDRLSKSESVYRELRSRIVSGRYVAGYRIVLDQIARELGVSPVPVREAVWRLQAEKLVTFTKNVGAEVASIDTGDYADAMETLAFIEGAATSLAAAHLTESQLHEASETNDQLRRLAAAATFDPKLFSDLNLKFHRQLCISCPNSRLLFLLDREWERVSVIRRNVSAFEPITSHRSVAEHDQIIQLIRDHASLVDIEFAARNHKLRTRQQYLASSPELLPHVQSHPTPWAG